MTSLWNSTQAAQATHGTTAGSWEASSVSIDSRALAPGALHVALVGERVDGHQFAAHALERGAAAVMVSAPPAGVPVEKLLVVANTQKALEDLGRAGRQRAQGRIVGLTGSVGKTSTKEMLRAALSAHGETFASHGNFNNHIGTPLNLANLLPVTPFAVFEMGMNHAGEIDALTRMVRPHVALITNVEAAHLEFFANVEGIAEAKAEIFVGLEEGGTAVLNRDNAHYAYLAQQAHDSGIRHILTFGRHAEADCRLVSYRATLEGSEITAMLAGQELSFTTRTIGAHWALTALSVLAVTHALGLDAEKTVPALRDFSELSGRGSLHSLHVSGGTVTLVDDSYNASPAAMRAAIEKLAELRQAGACKGRILAALGDMRELGDTGPQLHAELAEHLVRAGVDSVFTAGSLMRHLHEALPANLRGAHAPDAKSALPLVKEALKPGDVLLVKGSHGSLMYQLAEALLAGKELRHAV